MRSKCMLFFLMIFVVFPAFCAFAESLKSSEQPASKNKKIDEELRAQFDFEATTLEGKAKAPPGLTLQGRVHQEKSQMVKLRTQFRSKIDKSAYIVETANP